MNITKRTVKISDFYFAAFLKTAGFLLVEVVKSPDGKRNLFVFEDNTGLITKAQTEYINGVSKIVAKDLIDNIRALKTLTNVDNF